MYRESEVTFRPCKGKQGESQTSVFLWHEGRRKTKKVSSWRPSKATHELTNDSLVNKLLVLSCNDVSCKQNCKFKPENIIDANNQRSKGNIRPNSFCEQRKRAKWACATNERMIGPGDEPSVTLQMRARQGRDVAWTLLHKRSIELDTKSCSLMTRLGTSRREEPFP